MKLRIEDTNNAVGIIIRTATKLTIKKSLFEQELSLLHPVWDLAAEISGNLSSVPRGLEGLIYFSLSAENSM